MQLRKKAERSSNNLRVKPLQTAIETEKQSSKRNREKKKETTKT